MSEVTLTSFCHWQYLAQISLLLFIPFFFFFFKQHQPIPYKYGYEIHGGDEHHGDFSQSRQEHSDGHGNVQGSYSYKDAHGNQRIVEYIADHHGFRAKVQTNEPGKHFDFHYSKLTQPGIIKIAKSPAKTRKVFFFFVKIGSFWNIIDSYTTPLKKYI